VRQSVHDKPHGAGKSVAVVLRGPFGFPLCPVNVGFAACMLPHRARSVGLPVDEHEDRPSTILGTSLARLRSVQFKELAADGDVRKSPVSGRTWV
jgi:hypothetical protein